MKYLLIFLRILVGVLFIFSGLIKANDPLGLSYKMTEFFEVLHMTAFIPMALVFSICMIAFEIIAGVAVILGYAYELFSFLLLLLIALFTFLTAYALFTGNIKECGCFGDCIKISNTETFVKDVALFVFIVVLFIYRKKVTSLFSKQVSIFLLVVVSVASFGIQFYVLKHLPFKDCLAYKVGNNIEEKMKVPPGAIPDQFETVMIYEKNGKQQSFTMQNYPWQDTTWKFVDSKTQLVKKGNAEPEIKGFAVNDVDGNDYTTAILQEVAPTFILFVKDPATAHEDKMKEAADLLKSATQQGAACYIFSSGSKEVTQAFQKKWGLEGIQMMQFDGTESKTAMRSNPGLMLLQKGTITNKWGYADFPSSCTIKDGAVIIPTTVN
ncbi:MAG: DoxX family protein [Chitinophagia bacterium]|nr:DoxX family protein [Chitinophagia bacterium]